MTVVSSAQNWQKSGPKSAHLLMEESGHKATPLTTWLSCSALMSPKSTETFGFFLRFLLSVSDLSGHFGWWRQWTTFLCNEHPYFPPPPNSKRFRRYLTKSGDKKIKLTHTCLHIWKDGLWSVDWGLGLCQLYTGGVGGGGTSLEHSFWKKLSISTWSLRGREKVWNRSSSHTVKSSKSK